MLDEEVAVEGLRERDAGEPPLVLLALVPELVRGVDGDAADTAEGDGEADLVDRGETQVGERPAAPDQGAVLEGGGRDR
ncbi:hypothetical protein [Nostocoides sp. HKS02]|uniref:hypothetical protein n=1 Tax=Nostocoides sp. HKS02 TaxID=1813880 RepID=UPI001E345295|nr:hypothetical protein [Tetrasphaera sp. HKS02]